MRLARQYITRAVATLLQKRTQPLALPGQARPGPSCDAAGLRPRMRQTQQRAAVTILATRGRPSDRLRLPPCRQAFVLASETPGQADSEAERGPLRRARRHPSRAAARLACQRPRAGFPTDSDSEPGPSLPKLGLATRAAARAAGPRPGRGRWVTGTARHGDGPAVALPVQSQSAGTVTPAPAPRPDEPAPGPRSGPAVPDSGRRRQA